MRGNRGGHGGKRGSRSGGSSGNRGPRLPQSLLDEVHSTSRVSGFAGSRKDQRKLARQEKKQKKAIHHSGAHSSSSSSHSSRFDSDSDSDDDSAQVSANREKKSSHLSTKDSKSTLSDKRMASYFEEESGKRRRDDLDASSSSDDENHKSSRHSAKKKKQEISSKGGSKRKSHRDNDSSDDLEDESDMSDIEDDTAEFDPELAAALDARGLAALGLPDHGDDDERLIRELERKLGLPHKAGKRESKSSKDAIRRLNKEFAGEGLDDDFGSYLAHLDKALSDGSESEDAEEDDDAHSSVMSSEDEEEEEEEEEEEKIVQQTKKKVKSTPYIVQPTSDDSENASVEEEEEDWEDSVATKASNSPELEEEESDEDDLIPENDEYDLNDLLADSDEDDEEEDGDEVDDDDESFEVVTDGNQRMIVSKKRLAKLIDEEKRFRDAANYRRKLLRRMFREGIVVAAEKEAKPSEETPSKSVSFVETAKPAIIIPQKIANVKVAHGALKGLVDLKSGGSVNINFVGRDKKAADDALKQLRMIKNMGGPAALKRAIKAGILDGNENDETMPNLIPIDGDGIDFADEFVGSDDDSEDEEDEDEDDDEEEEEDDEEDDEDDEGDDEDDEGDDSDEVEEEEEEEKDNKKSNGNTQPNIDHLRELAAEGKYIPPHLRRLLESEDKNEKVESVQKTKELDESESSVNTSSSKSLSSDEKLLQWQHDRYLKFSVLEADLSQPHIPALQRQVGGLLNRLGEANAEKVAQDLAQLYKSGSINELNTIISTHMLDQLEHHTQTTDSLCLSFAAVVSALHTAIGPQVGANIAEKALTKFAISSALPLLPAPTAAELRAMHTAYQSLPDFNPEVHGLRHLVGGSANKNLKKSEMQKSKYPAFTNVNTLLFIALLYVFQALSSHAVVHALTLLAERLEEIDAPALLTVLKFTGFFLRNDDPAGLKEVLKRVHRRLKESSVPLDASAFSSNNSVGDADNMDISARLRVLAELTLDLKNNRRKTEAEQRMDRVKRSRKWISRFSNSVNNSDFSVDRKLRIGWPDVMCVPEYGRWWTVGSSWIGRVNSVTATTKLAFPFSSRSHTNINEDRLFFDWEIGGAAGSAALSAESTLTGLLPVAAAFKESDDPSLLELAKEMKMNSPARRSIFIALMGADSVDSAVERALRLHLKGSAEREIIRVIIDCCAQERTYNPFYAAVAARLCVLYPRFKFTLQLALWDFFKTFVLSKIPEDRAEYRSLQRRSYNVALLFAACVSKGIAALTVLKPLDMTGQNSKEEDPMGLGLLFLKTSLGHLILANPKGDKARAMATIAEAFNRLGAGADKMQLRDSLQVFIREFLGLKTLMAQASVHVAAAAESCRQAAATDSKKKPAVSVEEAEKKAGVISSPVEIKIRLKAVNKVLDAVTVSTAEMRGMENELE